MCADERKSFQLILETTIKLEVMSPLVLIQSSKASFSSSKDNIMTRSNLNLQCTSLNTVENIRQAGQSDRLSPICPLIPFSSASKQQPREALRKVDGQTHVNQPLIYDYFSTKDAEASCDLNDNDQDPMPRDTDPDNWYVLHVIFITQNFFTLFPRVLDILWTFALHRGSSTHLIVTM